MWFRVFQWFAVPLGAFLVITGILVRDRYEKHLKENRVWRWWYGVTGTKETIIDKLSALARALANGTLKALNWLFGEKPISLHAIWFSFALTDLLMSLEFYHREWRPLLARGWSIRNIVIHLSISVLIALVPAVAKSNLRPLDKLVYCLAPIAFRVINIVNSYQSVGYQREIADLVAIGFASLVADIAFLALLRFVLRRAAHGGERSLVYLGAIIAIPVVILAVRHSLPTIVPRTRRFSPSDGPFDLDPRIYLSSVLYYFVIINALHILVSLSLLTVLFLLVFVLLLTGFLQVVLERLEETFPERKYVVGFGIFLVSSAAWHSFAEMGHALAKKIGLGRDSTEQQAPKEVAKKPTL